MILAISQLLFNFLSTLYSQIYFIKVFAYIFYKEKHINKPDINKIPKSLKVTPKVKNLIQEHVKMKLKAIVFDIKEKLLSEDSPKTLKNTVKNIRKTLIKNK